MCLLCCVCFVPRMFDTSPRLCVCVCVCVCVWYRACAEDYDDEKLERKELQEDEEEEEGGGD